MHFDCQWNRPRSGRGCHARRHRHLTAVNTYVASTTKTNGAGFYIFPGLVPGPYGLAAESSGRQYDFFNALNHPSNPNSIDSTGILSVQSSGNGPRTLQLSRRLTW